MKIPVALELKLPGHIGAFHASEPFADMEYLGRTLRFAAPVSVDAEYVFDGSGFSVKGTLKTSLHSQCARCAKEFEEPFETKFDERFEKMRTRTVNATVFRARNLMSAKCSVMRSCSTCCLTACAGRTAAGYAPFAGAI